jgi:ABC-type thiamine transport system ATPase subunit
MSLPDLSALLSRDADLLLALADEELAGLVDRAAASPAPVGVVSARYPLLHCLDVAENLCLARVYRGGLRSRSRCLEELAPALDALGLADALHRLPEGLDRARRTAVLAARCLANRARFILLHNPETTVYTAMRTALDHAEPGVHLWVGCVPERAPAFHGLGLKPVAGE